MRLTHCTAIETWLEPRNYYLSIANDKPDGLWVDAPISTQDKSWREFAIETGVRDASVRYEVKLDKDARIALLSSLLDLRVFTEEFGKNRTLSKFNVLKDRFPEVSIINWEAVGEKYQGILISPYIQEC